MKIIPDQEPLDRITSGATLLIVFGIIFCLMPILLVFGLGIFLYMNPSPVWLFPLVLPLVAMPRIGFSLIKTCLGILTMSSISDSTVRDATKREIALVLTQHRNGFLPSLQIPGSSANRLSKIGERGRLRRIES